MRSHQASELLLAETATSAGTTTERAQALLEGLRQLVPFDVHGWHSPTRWATATSPWRASTWTSRPWSSSPAR